MKTLIIVWLFVLLADNILPFALAAFYPEYSHKKSALSVLGCRQSPVKLIYNIWCIISGAIFCVAPYSFYKVNPTKLSISIWSLLAVYGIGCEIISGFCPLNEKKEDTDILTKIHGGLSAIGFMALLFVPLLLSISSFKSNFVLGCILLILFIAGFVFFCFFVMGDKEKFANTVFAYEGLWQRFVLLTCYVSLLVFCFNLII